MNVRQAHLQAARIGSQLVALAGAAVMTLALMGSVNGLATSAAPAGLLAQMHVQPAQG